MYMSITTGNDTPILFQVLRDPDISTLVHWFKYERDPLNDKSTVRQKVVEKRHYSMISNAC